MRHEDFVHHKIIDIIDIIDINVINETMRSASKDALFACSDLVNLAQAFDEVGNTVASRKISFAAQRIQEAIEAMLGADLERIYKEADETSRSMVSTINTAFSSVKPHE